MSHREIHKEIIKMLVIYIMKSTSGSRFLLSYKQPSSPSLPVLSLKAESGFLSSPPGECSYSHGGRGTSSHDSLQGATFGQAPTSPARSRTRSSQMPWMQRALEPPSQSLYLDAHWGPCVSGEQRQLSHKSTMSELVLQGMCFLASI